MVDQYRNTVEDWLRLVNPSEREWEAVVTAASQMVVWSAPNTGTGDLPWDILEAVCKDVKRNVKLTQCAMTLASEMRDANDAPPLGRRCTGCGKDHFRHAPAERCAECQAAYRREQDKQYERRRAA